jgi:hypothetical protein
MAGGDYVRVSAEESEWQWLFRVLWFSIMQHTQNLENIFNKWDVCALGKCKMDVRRMVCRVAYAANVLPALEALRQRRVPAPCGRDARGCCARCADQEEGAGASRPFQCERSLRCQMAVEAEQ